MVLVRYDDSADAKHIPNQLQGFKKDEELKENFKKYPRES